MTEFVKGSLQEKQFEHLSHYPGAGSFEIANSEEEDFQELPSGIYTWFYREQ